MVAKEIAMPDEYKSYTLSPKFGTRKTDLRSSDKAELNRIIEQWKSAKNLQIEVTGHTDSIRIAPHNRKEFANNYVLSDARAEVVAAYIAQALRIPMERVVKRGAGPDQPVASNKTAQGRQKNRRVEVKIAGDFPAIPPTQTVMQAVPSGIPKASLVNPRNGLSEKIDLNISAAENLLNTRSGKSTKTVSNNFSQDSLSNSDEAPAIIAQNFIGENDLRLQNIPVYGSRVRISGQDVADNYKIQINDVTMPLDEYGKFASEYIMPVGRHKFDVALLGQGNQIAERGQLDVDVSGKHMFLVALADVNIAQNNINGSLETLAANDEFDGDVFVNGRLAYYLKGKVKGKYLITSQMDTTEEDIGDIFKNIHRKDPRSVFRRLDPDRYYPVYGDDSTTYSDTDTQGRVYVRVDWDKSRATWGKS